MYGSSIFEYPVPFSYLLNNRSTRSMSITSTRAPACLPVGQTLQLIHPIVQDEKMLGQSVLVRSLVSRPSSIERFIL